MSVFTLAGQYGPEDVRQQDPTTKLLIVPTSASVYPAGSGTLATLYTDASKDTVAANPVATLVAANTAGLDVVGNLLFFADPGLYKVVFNGGRSLQVLVGVDPGDIGPLVTGGAAGKTTIQVAGGTVLPARTVVNIQGLRSGKIVDQGATLDRYDVDLGDAITYQLNSDQTVNNNNTITTVSDLTDFAVPLKAGHKYCFAGEFFFTSTNAAGVKLRIQGQPANYATTVMGYCMEAADTNQTSFSSTQIRRATIVAPNNGAQAFAGFDTSNNAICVQVFGGYAAPTVDDTLGIRFCQSTATAVDTKMLGGMSMLRVYELA